MTQTSRTARSPRPAPTPWIDIRALIVAVLIASPALYRSQQGLLSSSATLERFGMIAGGCLLLSIVVRTLWPIVIGSEPTRSAPAAQAGQDSMTTGDAADPMFDGELSGFDDLDLGSLDGFDAAPATMPGGWPAAG